MSYNARAEPLFCSLNLLFNDVPVVVAVVVILNSLLRKVPTDSAYDSVAYDQVKTASSESQAEGEE